MALKHGIAKRVGAVQGNRIHAEEFQALHQLFGPLQVLQGQVHRLAQGWQHGLLKAIAMPQARA